MSELLEEEPLGSILKHAGVVARYLRGGPQAVMWMLTLDDIDWAIVSMAARLASMEEQAAQERSAGS